MEKIQGQSKKVIIVGAGIAGITAAKQLGAKGYQVSLLEAWKDVGGRARVSNGMPLGPVVVHEVGEYSGKGGIEAYIQSHPEYLFAHADLAPMQPMPAVLENYGIPMIMRQGGLEDSVIVVGDKAEDFNLQNFNAFYQKYRQEYTQNYYADLSQCPDNQTLEDHFARELITTFEVSFSGLAIQELTEIMQNAKKNKIDFFQYGDAHPLVAEGGYYALIKNMQNDLKNVNVYLNTEVIKMALINEKVITITKDGHHFEADAIISTIPLGVLQKNKVEIPGLSESKKTAIRHLKMGLMTKVLLRFEHQFWTNRNSVFVVLDITSGNRPITALLNPNQGWPDKEPCLMGAFFADEATMDAKKMIEITKTAIKKAWPKSPNPISEEIIKWSDDPYTYGSYASFSKDTHQDDIVNLMRPEWDGKLLFAGDAVVPVGLMGCFHGAYISAMRAARLIDEHLRASA